MLEPYETRVVDAGGRFAEQFEAVMSLIRGPKPEEPSRLWVAEAMLEAIRTLQRADLDVESAKEKALRDLNKLDQTQRSNPGQLMNTMPNFPFTYPWASQLEQAVARYDSALIQFNQLFRIGEQLGMWTTSE